MKKSALTAGAVMLLSQGVALANDSSSDYSGPSNLGCVGGNWAHAWGTEEFKDNTGRTYVKCTRDGCGATSVVG